jgi:hypothetical protein
MSKPLHRALFGLLFALGCSESFRPTTSTETGNPPVIDSTKVTLVVTSDELYVRGEPGAVTPPDGEVEITTISTGAVTTGPVQSNGSFDVAVDAGIEDTFEVRAALDGALSAPVFVIRGGAAIGGGEGGALTCDQRNEVATELLDQAAGAADRACAVDADCVTYTPISECSNSCWVHYLSVTALASIEATRALVEQAVCVNSESMCATPIYDCSTREISPSCDNGLCVAADLNNCDTCQVETLTWQATGSGILLGAPPDPSIYAISDCNTFTTTTLDGSSCSHPISRCGSVNQDASVSLIRDALEHPDVVAAFEAGGTHGAPNDQAAFSHTITLGDRSFIYQMCAQRDGCSVPAGLSALRALLGRASNENRCTPEAN